jgi:hypothetical protein
MNRLADSRWRWWTRRVNGWTLLVWIAPVEGRPSQLTFYETVIGTPSFRVRP